MFSNIPPVTKNLLIINVLMLLAYYACVSVFGIDLNDILGYHYPQSDAFKPYQFVTYMFMHGGFLHLFFNMFALYMFGRILESVWGGKRFFVFYIVTGLGAILTQTIVNYFQFNAIYNEVIAFNNTPTPDGFEMFVLHNFKGYYESLSSFIADWNKNPESSAYFIQAKEYIAELIKRQMDIPTVGASGAVFGILLGFGMLFPNTELMLLFPPIPIKAKYMVIIYGAMELILAVTQQNSNIAHVAHLGGMVFGFIMIKLWSKNKANFY